MEEKRIWNRQVRVKVVVVVALVSLLVGLGVSGGLDGLRRAAGPSVGRDREPRRPRPVGHAAGFPDFVNLAKQLSPIVVKSRRLKSPRGRRSGIRESFGGGEEEIRSAFWRRFFGGPEPARPVSAKRSLARASSSIRTALFSPTTRRGQRAKIIVKLADEREFEAR